MKLVDSSAWVEFFRSRGDAAVKQIVANLMQGKQAAFTCPVRFELLSGARPQEEAYLEEMLSFCEHVPFRQDDWRSAALLERQLRKQGVTVPRNDLFVMIVAIRTSLPVVCRDAHFTAAAKTLGSHLKVEQI